MKVIIKSYIDTQSEDEVTLLNKAREMVNGFDTINDMANNEDVITKLYIISPTLGKIAVVVTEADKNSLGVESDILALTNISEYPISKLPSKIIEYKELLIKKESTLDLTSIKNAGQALIDGAMSEVMPYKIPLLKIINYRDEVASELVMPSSFGENIFLNTDAPIVNDGDADAGDVVLSGGWIDITERALEANEKSKDGGYGIFGYHINASQGKLPFAVISPKHLTDLVSDGDTLKINILTKDSSKYVKNIDVVMPDIFNYAGDEYGFMTVADYEVNGKTYDKSESSARVLVKDLLKDTSDATYYNNYIRLGDAESIKFYVKKADS